MLSRYVADASSYAFEVDHLVLLMTIVVGFWFLLAEAVLFWLILRFAAKEGQRALYIGGDNKYEKRWVSIPHYATLVFDVLILVSAMKVWADIKLTMPKADETVGIISQQWAWTFVHPGVDGKLNTTDDIRTVDELHLEKGKTYHFELTSRDVIHSLSIPAFRLKQDAIPGRVITGWFKPTLTGQFDIQCAEICGIGHALMPARAFIEDAETHAAWVKANAPLTQIGGT